MDRRDKIIIAKLIKDGYKVVVDDPYGDSFLSRYTVYQSVFFDQLKIAIVKENGDVLCLAG